MDAEAVPGSVASPDPGYHDDDELAAALAAQLDQVIETGSTPLQRDGSAGEAGPARASAPEPPAPAAAGSSALPPPAEPGPGVGAPAVEPPALTGPGKPPSHRADAATTGTGPISAEPAPEHRAEHRAERSPGRSAHRSDAPRENPPAAPSAAPSARAGAPTAVVAALRPVDAGPPDTGGVPTTTGSVPLSTGAVPVGTGSLPLSRRARRAEERARAQARAEAAPSEPPAPDVAPVPAPPGTGAQPVEPEPEPALSPPVERNQAPLQPAEDVTAVSGDRAMALRHPLVVDLPAEDPEAPAGPVRHRRSFQPPAEPPPDSGERRVEAAEPPVLKVAAAPAVAPPDGGPEAEPSPGVSEAWGRALRILGGPVREEELAEQPGEAQPAPVHTGSWFEEPLPTTGTVVLSGAPTGPVPVAEPDDADEVDEVESGFDALGADTASVGVLPPLVDEAGRHVVPAISRESLDRERLLEAVTEEPPARTLRSGLVAPLATWVGAAGSPLAIVAGFALGGGASTELGLVLGLVLALPAVVRLGAVGARTGRDGVTASRALLGEAAGTAAGIVLLVGRIAIAALGLLGVADIANAYAGRTGLGGSLPASGAAILAVLLAGLLALAVGAWPGRIVGVVLGAAGAVALFASAAMLVVLAGTPGAPPPAGASPLPAVVAGFTLVGLVVASGAAEVTRRPLAGGPWRLPVVGSVLGAAGAVAVLALGAMAAGGAAGASGAADAFVGALVDATSVALVGPIAVLLLLSALALVATASRAAGTAAVALLDRGRSTGLGTAAATLVAIAVALAALAGGLGGSTALTRLGPLVAVPLTAVLAALTAAPAMRRGTGRAPLVALGIAVLLGWLLVDHLLVPGERGPLLDLFGLPVASAWRTTPALGLLVAALGGALAGGLAHVRSRTAKDDTTERLPAMDTAAPE